MHSILLAKTSDVSHLDLFGEEKMKYDSILNPTMHSLMVEKLAEKILLKQSNLQIDIPELLQGHQPKPKELIIVSRQVVTYLKNVPPTIPSLFEYSLFL